MMNARIIFLMVAVLFIGKVYSGPIDTTTIYIAPSSTSVPEPTTTPVPPATTAVPTTTPVPPTTTAVPTTTAIVLTTTSVVPTTTTIVTTTTTTTLAPEVDREWEDLVLAGPTVVNYLSLFMVLVSRGDQDLNTGDGYSVKYIQNINSLRAILYQISSAMRGAFQGASDDLVRIRNSMQQIPDDVKAGLLLIKQGTHDILDGLLSYTLRHVERAAKEGSTVSKPTLNRFVSVGLLLEELVTVLGLVTPTVENADDLLEANAYATDMRTQWKLLEDLFEKFSERADITQASISHSFIEPIEQALQSSGFSSQTQRAGHLDKLIPIAIVIDQSSYLLDMMVKTYTDISNEHMTSQIAASTNYLNIGVESERATKQRLLWKNTVSQSIKVARLAQTRHNDFAETGSNRQSEYATYFIAI